MATIMTMDIHRVALETRNLMTWASQTWPCGANSFEHLHQTILFHMKRSAQTLPALEKDYNHLVDDNRKLQAEDQRLDDKLAALDRAREKLQKEIKDGKKMIANHLRTIDSCMANNSRLKDELGKARELQKLAPSRDDLVASVSRLEEELHTTRERLKFTVDCKRTATDTNEELKNDLEGAQARETITNELNNLIYVQRKDFEVERYFLEREKGAFETGMKYTKEREDEALRDLDVATRDLDINTAEVDRLNISNQDLSRRLCEQEQSQLEANTSRNATEDHCRTLQDELSGATASLEDLKVKLEEANQACSQTELELSILRKRLHDEVKTTTELTILIEEEKGESKARLREEQTKSTGSQTRQDRLTKELANSDATVQRLESELKVALVQVTAFEKEKADLSSDLDRSKSCEQHSQEELAKYARATDLLHAESERLSQKIVDLREKEKTEGEKTTSLRGRVQELGSALEDSQHHAATSNKANSALAGEIASAWEREGALDTSLASHRDEMTALNTNHSKTTQQLDVLREKLEDAEMRANAPQSHSDGNSLDLKRKTTLDKADEPTNDTTASCTRIQRHSKGHRRASVNTSQKPPDAAEESTNNATRPTPTAPRPEETLHKQSPLLAVEKAPAATNSPTSPPLSQPFVKTVHKATNTPKSPEGVVRASVPPLEPNPMTAAVHGDAPDPTPLNKKHARAADCDEQVESKMSKRARRRKRHRESLGVPASEPE
jgi:chromosome segregation ATPase